MCVCVCVCLCKYNKIALREIWAKKNKKKLLKVFLALTPFPIFATPSPILCVLVISIQTKSRKRKIKEERLEFDQRKSKHRHTHTHTHTQHKKGGLRMQSKFLILLKSLNSDFSSNQ